MKHYMVDNQEVDSIYVENGRDRFIVSLIVGYARDDLKGDTLPGKREFTRKPRTVEDFAKLAAAAALDLTRDGGSDGTTWFVYDRLTKRMFEFEQSDFEEALIL